MREKIQLPILLVITDNPSIQFWLKKHLDENFFIIEAMTKSKALEIIRNTPLDFIILDSSMEEIDLLNLCRSLRSANPIIPILLITGRLKKSFLDEALDAGATDFLNDQLDPEELRTRIATGRRAALIREKTQDLSSAIPIPKNKISSSYLKNKILLHDQALKLLQLAHKKQTPIRLLVVQIDHFSRLQTQKEYTFIEELLLKMNERIHSLLGESDLSIPSSEGRFILLSETSSPKAIAEKLQNDLLKTDFHIKGESLSISISVAISTIEPTEEVFNQTINTATQALKQAQATTNLIISLDKDTL